MESKYSYQFTKSAKNDLEQILHYIKVEFFLVSLFIISTTIIKFSFQLHYLLDTFSAP